MTKMKAKYFDGLAIPFALSFAVHILILFFTGILLFRDKDAMNEVFPVKFFHADINESPDMKKPDVSPAPEQKARASLPGFQAKTKEIARGFEAAWRPGAETPDRAGFNLKNEPDSQPAAQDPDSEMAALKPENRDGEEEAGIRNQPGPESAGLQSAALFEEHGLNRNGGAGQEDEMRLFLDMVREKIEKAKSYPGAAARRGHEGKVKVKFTILPDGNVTDVEAEEPSPRTILNQAALQAVERAAPFSRMPVNPANEKIKIRVDIVFKIEKNT